MNLEDSNEIKNYINQICAEVRNKRVHEEIKEELKSHLKEKATEYLNCGKNENEALKLAINEMGSSKHIGQELNELHKGNFEWSITLLCITLVLLSIGTIYCFEINGSFEKVFGGYSNYILNKSILWSIIGLMGLLIGCFIDYRKIKKYSLHIYIIGLILLCLVFLSPEVNGVVQWLQIGHISINMGYLGPILFIIALSGIYCNYKWSNKKNIIKGLLLGIIPLILLSMTGSLYSFLIYSIALIIVSYISKAPKKILGIFAIIEALILFLTKIRFNIIGFFINNGNDLNNSSYIHDQLKTIRDSSVLIGKAENFNKNGLPNFYSDYMFSYIVYNFGWIAGFIVIILITTLLIKIYRISKNIKNNYGSTLILGIASILGIQFIGHLLSNLGFINGNVPLPFISYGGTAMVFNMFIIGIIINVYKGRSISRIELS